MKGYHLKIVSTYLDNEVEFVLGISVYIPLPDERTEPPMLNFICYINDWFQDEVKTKSVWANDNLWKRVNPLCPFWEDQFLEVYCIPSVESCSDSVKSCILA